MLRFCAKSICKDCLCILFLFSLLSSADPELAAQGPQNRKKITATLGLVVHAAGKSTLFILKAFRLNTSFSPMQT